MPLWFIARQGDAPHQSFGNTDQNDFMTICHRRSRVLQNRRAHSDRWYDIVPRSSVARGLRVVAT